VGGEPVWIRDAGSEPNFPRSGAATQSGLHGGIGLPLVSGGETVGVFDFFSPQIQEPDHDLIHLMGTIGAQLGGFIQRKQAEDELAATAAELRVRATRAGSTTTPTSSSATRSTASTGCRR
jgi:GAF domain-containing protein